MHSEWLAFLASRGANVADDDGIVRDFGDAARERAAAAAGSIVADLSHYGVLTAGGADARAFLHSQLSCDVEGLADDAAAYGAYCTAKGRVLANVLLWAEAGTFFMLLPRSLAPGIRKRLQMFVLRSKVTLDDRSGVLAVLGAAGPGARGAVAGLLGTMPGAPLKKARGSDATVIAIPSDARMIRKSFRDELSASLKT